MKRVSLTAVALAVLLLGLLAGPAAAQDIEGFQSDADCAASIAAFYEVNEPAFFADEFAGLQGDALTTTVAGFLEINDLTFASLCAIYASGDLPPVQVEVGDDDDERPGEDPELDIDQDQDVAGEVEERQPEDEPVVMGQVLQRTGANTTVLLVAGLLLAGLGFLALRRTRPALGDDA